MKALENTIRIGLLGFGTVGQGVWKHLNTDRSALERRLARVFPCAKGESGGQTGTRRGLRIELVRAVVADLNKDRGLDLPADFLSDDPGAVIDDPDIKIICELMGGTGLARELTLRAFEQGKTVVTANKALICEHGEELFAAARRCGVHYFFEASVAGGIPVIKVLREGLVANRFPLIYGILNGTSNYLLTRMEREGLPFEVVVEDARALGYMEADEALDLDGWDAAHKAVNLAYLAHGKWVKLTEMLVEGIRGVTLHDVAYARQLGYKIKLLAIISRCFEAGTLSVRLHPALIEKEALMAQVDDVFNAVSLTGDVVGTTLLVGRGAGQDATASAVISDIADAVLAIHGGPDPVISEEDEEAYRSLGAGLEPAACSGITGAFYLRIRVSDQKGVLAKVTRTLSDAGLSVATMIQHEESATGSAVLLFTTHQASEVEASRAIQALDELPEVLDSPFLLRIFRPPPL